MRQVRRMSVVLMMAVVILGWTSMGWSARGFDGDSSPDLVFTLNFGNGNGQVTWYENIGSTVVGRDIITYCGSTFDTVAFCNLDGDEFPDLLIGGSNGLRWYEAEHKDTVTLVQEWAETGANYHDIQVLGGNIYVARKGMFGKLTSSGNNTATLVPLLQNGDIDYRTMAGGDFDHDGKIEILVGWNWVSTPSSGQIDLFEDDGTALAWKGTFSYAPGRDEFATGNFDGDGNLDLFISRDGQIDWFEANGSDDGLDWRGTLVYRKAVHLLLTDLDGDGKDDLLTSEVNNGEATRWIKSAGDNTIGDATNLNNWHYSGILVAGDWDKDGITDIFFGSKPGTYGIQHGEADGSEWNVFANYTYNAVDAAFCPGGDGPEPSTSQNLAFSVPAIGSIVADGNLSDWPESTAWSDAYIWWNGLSLVSTTKAKFAWNDANDLLYVAVQTDEHSVQPGGHLVIGLSKDLYGNPLSGNGATQLCFDIQGSSVLVRNEINLYNSTGDLTTDVQAGYSVNNGVYTFEVAIPFWSDWKQTIPANRQTLSEGEVVYLFSCMQDAYGTVNGTDLTWLGNPSFYMGPFDEASVLTLAGAASAQVPGDANNDSKVDVSDLGILAANYGTMGTATWETGDFNGDHNVDVSDLGILAANYGTGTGASLDFNKDARAMGLIADAKVEMPSSIGGLCGSAGIPLIAGVLLAGMMLAGLRVKE